MTQYKHEQLREWLKEYYQYEYLNLNQDKKNNIIDYVLDNNAKIFKAEDVTKNDYCTRCGYCCESMRCINYNPETKLCTQHNENRWSVCQTMPYGEEEFGLMLNFGLDCDYLVKFLITYFNKAFEKMEDLDG